MLTSDGSLTSHASRILEVWKQSAITPLHKFYWPLASFEVCIDHLKTTTPLTRYCSTRASFHSKAQQPTPARPAERKTAGVTTAPSKSVPMRNMMPKDESVRLKKQYRGRTVGSMLLLPDVEGTNDNCGQQRRKERLANRGGDSIKSAHRQCWTSGKKHSVPNENRSLFAHDNIRPFTPFSNIIVSTR